jgi:hypothetical protein
MKTELAAALLEAEQLALNPLVTPDILRDMIAELIVLIEARERYFQKVMSVINDNVNDPNLIWTIVASYNETQEPPERH